MSPLRKDPIPNQDNTIIITQQDPILQPLLAKWPIENKPFIDDTNKKTGGKHKDYTYNSCTENKDSVNKWNVKSMKIRMMNTKKIIQKIPKVIKLQ